MTSKNSGRISSPADYDDSYETLHRVSPRKRAIARLSEPSTYAGAAILVAMLGIDAEEWAVYSQGLAGVFAVIAMIVRESGSKE